MAAESGQSEPLWGAQEEHRTAWLPCPVCMSCFPTSGKTSEVLAAGCWHMGADASSVPLPGPCYQRGAEQADLSSTGKFQPALPQCAKAYNTWASRGGPVPH